MDKIFTKLALSFGTSFAVCESVNLQPVWNALISLACSIITVLSVEGVSWLRAYFKRKKEEEEKKSGDKNEPND